MADGSRLMVYTLGGFEMYYAGVPLQLKKKLTSKPLILLQMLLYNREYGVSRSAVLEALYGQETEIDAANSLNATVSQLRRLLRETHLPEGNYIRVRLDRYYFEAPCFTWVDTEEAVGLRQAADLASGTARQELLYQLCDLFHGRFLPDLDGESWVEIARADFQRIYRDSLNEVCRGLQEQRAYEEILRLTSFAARLFPFDEWQVWQQECLLAQGRIREAHELYRQVEKLYLTELNAPPPERMRARFRKPEKESWRSAESEETVRKWLRQEHWDGPYFVPFPGLMYAYNLIRSVRGAGGTLPCLLLCTISGGDSRSRELHSGMEHLESVLGKTLGRQDVFAHYSDSQFLVILPGQQPDTVGDLPERICTRFRGLTGGLKLRLDCRILQEELPQTTETT